MKAEHFECSCCGTMITMTGNNNAEKYDCPACRFSNCTADHVFVKITKEEFCKKANIELKKTWNEINIEKFVPMSSKQRSEQLDNWVKQLTGEISRCCGRCDGSHDICIADTVCEKHKELGCEICYGER